MHIRFSPEPETYIGNHNYLQVLCAFKLVPGTIEWRNDKSEVIPSRGSLPGKQNILNRLEGVALRATFSTKVINVNEEQTSS